MNHMKEIALYALLNGVGFTAELHSLEESTIRKWIKELDYDNEIFFVRVRELVYRAAVKSNVKRASELFSVPEWTVKLLMEDFKERMNPEKLQEISETTLKDENEPIPAERLNVLKKQVLSLHIHGKSDNDIAIRLCQPISRVKGWINAYKAIRARKQMKTEECPPFVKDEEHTVEPPAEEEPVLTKKEGGILGFGDDDLGFDDFLADCDQ